MLFDDDRIRYGRQIVYPEFGESGQERLKAAHVIVVGLGGLGCAASICLTYAGVGHITLVDSDSVELSNLNRQMLYWERDIGKKKPISAANKLRRINSRVRITPVCKNVTEDSVDEIIKGADVVIDGLDNFKTRFTLNAACVKQGVPFIHAGVNGLLGKITTIIPGKTPCLSCIYPDILDSEGAIPVFGVTAASMASLQVMEAIKLIAGFGETLGGRMLYLNGGTMEVAYEDLVRDPECSVCGGSELHVKENRK